jgi:hypothetical protein
MSVVAIAAVLLAGCDMLGAALGIESPDKVLASREAEGKAVGGACRHAGRAIEDCYAMNRKADKSAIFAGWRDMNDYMRENKIEPVPPQIGAKTSTATAEARTGAEADAADTSSAENATPRPKPGGKPGNRAAKPHDS